MARSRALSIPKVDDSNNTRKSEFAADSDIAPLHMPGFGRSLSWTMCRNACCENFGIPHDPGAPPKDRKSGGGVAKVDLKAGNHRCRKCEQQVKLRSNRAVRPIARYFLSLTLPFADCANEDCPNHGVNFFESCPPARGSRRAGARGPYRGMSERRFVCRECDRRRRTKGSTFTLGARQRVKGRETRESASQMLELLRGLAERRSLSDTIERLRISVAKYYAYLYGLSDQLRDYALWRNAALLRPGIERKHPVLRVQVDDIDIALRRVERSGAGRGKRRRDERLHITVAVAELEGTYFILCAHPHFLPERLCPDPWALDRERKAKLRDWESRWSCLAHGITGERAPKAGEDLPSISLDGCFIREPYAHVAHFLVLEKLLARFPMIHLYMDGSKALGTAALTVFADRVKAGTAEIVSFQHDKDRTGGQPSPLSLDEAWGEWQGRLKGRIEELSGGLPFAPEDGIDARTMARAWKAAAKGANSRDGGWAWLHWSGSSHYVEPRTLWVTWRPGKTLGDGRCLLEHATLQSVDSAFSAMRSRARGAGRAIYRARAGPGFRESYVSPRPVLAELVIAMLLFNFTRPWKGQSKFKPVPAQAMGITRPKEFVAKPGARSFKDDPIRRYFEVSRGFRLGVTQAARITKWLRQ